MSAPSPPPPVLADGERCAATTPAGILDAVLRCSLRAGHDTHTILCTVGEGPCDCPIEHEAWALPGADGYAGKAQLLASWESGS